MAKKVQKHPPKQQVSKKPESKKVEIKKSGPKLDKTFWIMAAIVFAVSFIFYAPSLNNEYALDDGIVMEKNEFVHKGTKGVREIMTKDAYASFFHQLGSSGQLSGGRYRPLSIVTFAVEHKLFGFHKGDEITFTGTDGKKYKGTVTKIAPNGDVFFKTAEFGPSKTTFTSVDEFKKLAHTQHFINVLLFSLSMVVLFYFLYHVLFRKLNKREYWALFATLVFAMHPIHSEVVANIKSRDEIMSLLFVLLTLISFDRFSKTANWKNGALMAIYFFLAMLSKEYGALLLIIIPIWAYIEQKKFDALKIFLSIVPLIIAFIPYYLLRDKAVMVGDPDIVKPDVLNDYYMYAKGDEARSTQIYILLKYFLLQIFPYPLSSDYSFKSIAYRHLSSPDVIASIIFHLVLIGAMGYAIIRKHLILSFALLFYLLNLILVSNLPFNIGASMGERLVYNSSLGLIIAVFYGLYVATKKLKDPKMPLYLAGGFTAVLAIPFFMITADRCAAWKNDFTLATTDVKTNSNSALLNANAGTYLNNKSELPENKEREKEMLLQAKVYILKAIEVHPLMANAWMNLTILEHKLKNYAAAEQAIKKATEIFPNHPNIRPLWTLISNDYINVGYEKYDKEKKVDSCFYFLYHAKQIAPFNPEAYYNLGGAYLSVAKNVDSAIYYFNKTLQISPGHVGATKGLGSMGIQPTQVAN